MLIPDVCRNRGQVFKSSLVCVRVCVCACVRVCVCVCVLINAFCFCLVLIAHWPDKVFLVLTYPLCRRRADLWGHQWFTCWFLHKFVC